MALLQRNVTGHDLLAVRSYIDTREPVSEDGLLADYYPGDPEDPETSEQLKPIRDSVRFLHEIDQIEDGADGYTISPDIPDDLRPRLAVLWGIRRQDEEDAAYFEVLQHLASENITRFDHGDELVDMMDGARPDLPWNPDRLRYWRRVMNTLGVTQEINPDSEDVTTLVSPEADRVYDTITYCLEGHTGSLAAALENVNDTFLPVYSGQGLVSEYMQTSLQHLDRQDRIDLARRSDRDVSINVAGTPYNSIELIQQS
jgi:hypothetical protein